ncbi:hypothetical protein SteCoe_15444 [Stentor coeruleus]|uniref:non-specific serine/threonine protein kinase n=1 Tax=Stentor coeruleus TaxID=5963 RepID=A0A1R2C3J3_9CILI|nr:hypothetical protein SteCoe_15444 [Stentor coeruleus]
MGGICAGKVMIQGPLSPRHPLVYNTKYDIKFNAGQFVQENTESFYDIYTLDKSPIGTGAFAEVWLCTHQLSNELRAVKILHKSGISEEDIRIRSVFMEVEILKTLDHPNILKVYEYFEDDQNYYIIMEYCEGGDVFDKLEQNGPFTERYAAKAMRFLLSGLNYLHSRRVVHRDIKPENLLITNGGSFEDFNIKIIDFNVATRKETKKIQGVSGTTDYMAPEVFRGVYDEKCDLWSAGIVLYLMMSTCLPFASPNDEEAEKNICIGKFSFPNEIFGNVSKSCKDLIIKLLTKNPSSRPSALEALTHPWLKIAQERVDKSAYEKTLTKLKTIKSTSKLKDLFTTFMISQLSNLTSTRKLEKVFYQIDKNKDGTINMEELIEELQKEMPLEDAKRQAEEIMSNIDSDGSGQVDYTEYLKIAIEEETLLTKENLKKAFCYFDKDRSGSIEKTEMRKWLGTGDIIPEEIITDLMNEADVNGDGTIDLSEFESLLISRLDLEEPTTA